MNDTLAMIMVRCMAQWPEVDQMNVTMAHDNGIVQWLSGLKVEPRERHSGREHGTVQRPSGTNDTVASDNGIVQWLNGLKVKPHERHNGHDNVRGNVSMA